MQTTEDAALRMKRIADYVTIFTGEPPHSANSTGSFHGTVTAQGNERLAKQWNILSHQPSSTDIFRTASFNNKT